ncbi:MAG: hypothetical protein MK364_09140, partial [Pirellulales bacterium]|nr:hypothetical protein [Pirellulales bacterium]
RWCCPEWNRCYGNGGGKISFDLLLPHPHQVWSAQKQRQPQRQVADAGHIPVTGRDVLANTEQHGIFLESLERQ